MERHLPAAKLKRYGRASAFDDPAAGSFEHGLDTRPLNVSIDRVGLQLLEGLSLRSVHPRMIALVFPYAITS